MKKGGQKPGFGTPFGPLWLINGSKNDHFLDPFLDPFLVETNAFQGAIWRIGGPKRGTKMGSKIDHFIDPFWDTHRTFLGATFGKEVSFGKTAYFKTTFFDEKVNIRFSCTRLTEVVFGLQKTLF